MVTIGPLDIILATLALFILGKIIAHVIITLRDN